MGTEVKIAYSFSRWCQGNARPPPPLATMPSKVRLVARSRGQQPPAQRFHKTRDEILQPVWRVTTPVSQAFSLPSPRKRPGEEEKGVMWPPTSLGGLHTPNMVAVRCWTGEPAAMPFRRKGRDCLAMCSTIDLWSVVSAGSRWLFPAAQCNAQTHKPRTGWTVKRMQAVMPSDTEQTPGKLAVSLIGKLALHRQEIVGQRHVVIRGQCGARVAVSMWWSNPHQQDRPVIVKQHMVVLLPLCHHHTVRAMALAVLSASTVALVMWLCIQAANATPIHILILLLCPLGLLHQSMSLCSTSSHLIHDKPPPHPEQVLWKAQCL